MPVLSLAFYAGKKMFLRQTICPRNRCKIILRRTFVRATLNAALTNVRRRPKQCARLQLSIVKKAGLLNNFPDPHSVQGASVPPTHPSINGQSQRIGTGYEPGTLKIGLMFKRTLAIIADLRTVRK